MAKSPPKPDCTTCKARKICLKPCPAAEKYANQDRVHAPNQRQMILMGRLQMTGWGFSPCKSKAQLITELHFRDNLTAAEIVDVMMIDKLTVSLRTVERIIKQKAPPK